MGVTCFMMEDSGLAEVGLRRYQRISGGEPCPGRFSYHNATVIIGQAPYPKVEDEHGGHWGEPEFTYPGHDDPRWPKACDCGYEFTPDDAWQNWSRALYRLPSGDLTTIQDAPEGAMWEAWWYPRKGPDGRSLAVKCPGGCEWLIDSEATNGGFWTRTGEPPQITATPSIQTANYHGWLRAGVFEQA